MNDLLQKKIRSGSGVARLIVLMAVIAVALAAVIIVPAVLRMYEARLEADDEDYIIAAERMARHDYLNAPMKKSMIFDSINKQFVELSELDEVEHYASSKLHKDDYLIVTFGGDESAVVCRWMPPYKIRKLAAREATNKND